MLKKIVSALTGKGEEAQADAGGAEGTPVGQTYTIPWCEVHNEALRHVERLRPRRGTRESYERPVTPEDQFNSPSRAQFPHSRPSDPWITHYDYCATCESIRVNWKSAVAVEMKREADAEAKLKKKRHWQDD